MYLAPKVRFPYLQCRVNVNSLLSFMDRLGTIDFECEISKDCSDPGCKGWSESFTGHTCLKGYFLTKQLISLKLNCYLIFRICHNQLSEKSLKDSFSHTVLSLNYIVFVSLNVLRKICLFCMTPIYLSLYWTACLRTGKSLLKLSNNFTRKPNSLQWEKKLL